MVVNSALQAIAEPRRERILELVWHQDLSAGEIAAQFDVTFGAISQHLRILSDAGLVVARREGRKRIYSVRKDALGPLAAALEEMWRAKLSTLKELAEAEELRSSPRKAIVRRTRSRSNSNTKKRRPRS